MNNNKLLLSILVALFASAWSACVVGGSPTYTTTPQYAASSVVIHHPSSGECSGIGPLGIALDNNNNMYTCNYVQGQILKFNLNNPLPISATASNLFYAIPCAGLVFDGRYLWVSSNNNFIRFDLTLPSPTPQNMGSRSGIFALAVNPANGDIYASTFGQLVRFQRSTNTISTVHNFAVSIDGITIDPIGKYLYGAGGGKVQRVDLTTFAETTIAIVSGGPDGIALAANPINPSSPPYLFVNRNDGIVTKIDLSTNTQTNIVTGGTRGDFAAVGPDGCFYGTQSNSVLKITNADGTCSLSPTSPHPAISIINPSLTCGAVINVPFAGSQSITFHGTSADPLNTIDASLASSSGDTSGVTFSPSLPTAPVTSPNDILTTFSSSLNVVSASVTVKVTDRFNAVASCAATFCTIPSLTGDSCISGSGEINIFPSDTSGQVQYQLYKDGVAIGSTQNSDTFIVESEGDYSVSYYDARTGCNVQSVQTVHINVAPAPVISVSQGQATSCDGSTVTLTVDLIGDYSYQWFHNNVAISGANSASISLSQVSDSGSYYVSVTYNPSGCSGNSNSISLTFVALPNANFQVNSNSFCEGGQVTFTANAGYTYSWKKNGNVVGTSQTLGPLNSVSDSGSYVLTVTTISPIQCSSSSLPYQLTINPNPVVTASASPSTVYLGFGPSSCSQLSCSATISSPNQNNPINYQWLAPINQATTNTQVCANQLQSGSNSLTCQATDSVTGCSATSSVTVSVVDSRCGPKQEKVLVCHLRSSPNPHTICIAEPAVAAHLSHGDTLGYC